VVGAPAPSTASWRLTTRYTPVESFHTGAAHAVTGCPPGANECSNGNKALGSYPADFLQAVRDQGAGRLTSGKYAGQYLTWDSVDGYAVDRQAVDGSERPLRPFVSALGDLGVSLGSDFRVQDCGMDARTGRPIDGATCSRLTSASWTIVDQTSDPAGSRRLLLYIGEEDRPSFETSSPLVVDTVNGHTTLE
jgi:hypothetical protein